MDENSCCCAQVPYLASLALPYQQGSSQVGKKKVLHGRKLWKRTDLRMWEEHWHHREKFIPLPGATFDFILIIEPRLRITANPKGKKGGKWVEEGR